MCNKMYDRYIERYSPRVLAKPKSHSLTTPDLDDTKMFSGFTSLWII